MYKKTLKYHTPADQEYISSSCYKNSPTRQFIKPEIPQAVKAADKELAKLQTFVLDALAPLTSLLESNAKEETITHDQALDAAKAATQLLGSAAAQINHVRKTKMLTQLNKSLLPLLEEESNFDDVAPSLFGLEFACKSKE